MCTDMKFTGGDPRGDNHGCAFEYGYGSHPSGIYGIIGKCFAVFGTVNGSTGSTGDPSNMAYTKCFIFQTGQSTSYCFDLTH